MLPPSCRPGPLPSAILYLLDSAANHSLRDVWAIGVITYFLLSGYTPFDRDSNLEEMQAILVADYSFTPQEYWQNVSPTARKFINRCLTIDQSARMTTHEALAHPWITGEPDEASGEAAEKGKADLLPTVKKNFNARRTLHAAIDTIRAINQLRAGGALGHPAAQARAAQNPRPAPPDNVNPTATEHDGDPMEGVVPTHNKPAVARAAGMLPQNENVNSGVGLLGAKDVPPPAHPAPKLSDPRGHARGQTEEQIQEQARRIEETSRGLWEKSRR